MMSNNEKYEFLHLITDSLPLGVWVATAPDAKLVYANEKFEEIMGASASADFALDDIVAGYDIFDQQGQPYLTEQLPFSIVVRTQQSVMKDDIVVHRKDGQWTNIRVWAKPLFDVTGRLHQVLVSFLDITAEREAQNQLAEIDEICPVGLGISRMRDNIVIHANNAMLQIYGESREHFVGQPVVDRYANIAEREAVLAELKRNGSVTNRRVWMQCADRKRWLASMSLRKIRLSGEACILCALIDITDLYETERQMQKAQSLAQVGHWTLDAKTMKVDGSDECFRIFGLTRDEATLENFAAVVHEDDREYDLKHIRRGLTDGVSWDIQHRLTCRDGTEKVIQAIGEAITASDGQVTRLIGTVQDITARVRDEERRIQMINELDHRVKNNLAAVLSITELTFARTNSMDSFRKTFLGRIHAMAQAHETLATNRWKDCDLKKVLEAVLASYLGDSLKLEGSAVGLPSTVTTPLSMAVHELATNASKHGALSILVGSVTLSWTWNGEKLKLFWREAGGPMVKPSPNSGVGIKLIKGLIEHELGGMLEMRFEPAGLICHIVLPLNADCESIQQ